MKEGLMKKIKIIEFCLMVLCFSTACTAEVTESASKAAEVKDAKVVKTEKDTQNNADQNMERPQCMKAMISGDLKDVSDILVKQISDKKIFTGTLQETFANALKQYQKNLLIEEHRKDRQCLFAFLYVLAERADQMAAEELMADWYNYPGLPAKEEKAFVEDLKDIKGKVGAVEFAKKVIANLKAYTQGDSH